MESNPHRDGPNKTPESSLSVPESYNTQLQEWAEALATLISQVPAVQAEIGIIKAENEQRKEAVKAVSAGLRTFPNLTLRFGLA